jgi:mono/diheme cytochrome c family protein
VPGLRYTCGTFHKTIHLREEIMRARLIRFVFPAVALAAVFGAAACGSVATPEWAAEAQSTQVALAATSDHLTAIAPTHTPTNTTVPPTATNTGVPTATIAPTNTLPPTEAPTVAATAVPATAAPTEVANAGGNAANGQTIFTTQHTLPDGVSWMCASCHSVTPDEMVLIGPGLYNVSVRSQTYGLGETPEEYIHNSIVHPQDFIAPHPAGGQWPLLMPQWGEVLTDDEVNDLVAYLMTLHD